MRVVSVKNIQKITKSMKMVSAAKFSKAERDMKNGEGYAKGAQGLANASGVSMDNTTGRVILALSSDRGLCGGIHSTITKSVTPLVNVDPEAKVFVVGDKVRSQLQRIAPMSIAGVFVGAGKKPPTFSDASMVAQEVLDTEASFEKGQIVYNQFKSAISYEPVSLTFVAPKYLETAGEFNKYESVDEETLKAYSEFQLVHNIYAGMVQGSAAELAARMQAMENATKNADEMIDRLTLLFNRTRQAVITSELIEIISGAAAV